MSNYFAASEFDNSSALIAGSSATTVNYDDATAAIEALHEQYSKRLLVYAQTILSSREDAEDAVQCAFMNAYNAIVEGRVPRAESAWLYRIVRNACLNRIRTIRRKGASSIEGIDIADTSGVDEQLDQHLHAAALRSALTRLPVKQRQAIVMREFQGATYAEIAAKLETTTSAVESLIFRARRQVVVSFKSEGVLPNAA